MPGLQCFTISELLRENHRGVKTTPALTHTHTHTHTHTYTHTHTHTHTHTYIRVKILIFLIRKLLFYLSLNFLNVMLEIMPRIS